RIAHGRTHDRVPVEAVVMVEPTIFGRDERVSHNARNARERYVDATDVLEAANEVSRAVQHPTAFGRLVRADIRARRTPVEPTREKPRVAEHDRERRDSRKRERAPVASQPLRVVRPALARRASEERTPPLLQTGL